MKKVRELVAAIEAMRVAGGGVEFQTAFDAAKELARRHGECVNAKPDECWYCGVVFKERLDSDIVGHLWCDACRSAAIRESREEETK